MVFLVVVFLKVCVRVCCARCNEDLFFNKKESFCSKFVVFIPLFCLLFLVFALIF